MHDNCSGYGSWVLCVESFFNCPVGKIDLGYVLFYGGYVEVNVICEQISSDDFKIYVHFYCCQLEASCFIYLEKMSDYFFRTLTCHPLSDPHAKLDIHTDGGHEWDPFDKEYVTCEGHFVINPHNVLRDVNRCYLDFGWVSTCNLSFSFSTLSPNIFLTLRYPWVVWVN